MSWNWEVDPRRLSRGTVRAMPSRLTLLVTSAGRRNQLLDCFRRDGAALGLEVRLLAADLTPDLSPACRVAEARFTVPRCTEPAYVPALLEICRRERVTLLVPTIDTELPVLSANRAEFAAAGTLVVISSPELVGLARDKHSMAAFLERSGIPTPRTVMLDEFKRHPAAVRWPVIAKPAGGSSSVGIIKPKRAEELREFSAEDYIVQELWEGTEYTVNIFFDAAGRLRCAIPHERIETRAGEVSKGVTRRVPALEAAAQKLAAAMPGARGPLCFQAMVTASGDYAVLEINARFGGGYPLAHRAGATFTRWLLEEAASLPCTAHNDWRAGVTMLRYDAAVFVDG